MADAGLQAVLGLEEKGSLRPKMEKTLYSRWIWMEGALKRVSRVSFCGLYGLLGGRHRRGRKLGRILLKGEHCRIIPVESTFATVRLRTRMTRDCVSRQTILALVFQLGQSAQKRWHRLREFKHLAEVIR